MGNQVERNDILIEKTNNSSSDYFTKKEVNNKFLVKLELKGYFEIYLYGELKKELGGRELSPQEQVNALSVINLWTDKIIGYFSENNINENLITSFELHSNDTESRLDDSITIYYNQGGEDKQLNFAIYELDEGENIKVFGSLQEKQSEQREEKEKLEKAIKDFSISVFAMDQIFQENDKDIFDYLNEDDRFSSSIASDLDEQYKVFEGKTILEIQKITRINLAKIWQLQNKTKRNIIPSNLDTFRESQRKYLNMVMGTGDIYGGGVEHFRRSTNELETLAFEGIILPCKTPKDLLSELVKLNSRIDRHNWTSDAQKSSYRIFTETLGSLILKMLDKLGATDQDYLEYARIVTGRKGDNDMDYETDTTRENANEALRKILLKKGGILEELYNMQMMEKEDEAIKGRSPSQIIGEYNNALKEKIDGELPEESLSEFDGKKHKELSVEQKIKIGFLARVLDKVNKRFSYKMTSRGSRRRKEDKKLYIEDLSEIITNTTNEAEKGFFNSINDNLGSNFKYFLGMSSNDLSEFKTADGKPLFSKTDLESFDLYNKINGNGIFNFSDKVVGWGVTGSKITTLVAASMLLTYATAGLSSTIGAISGISRFSTIGTSIVESPLTGGVVAGLWSAPAGWVVFPDGHDSMVEMLVNRLSDLGISVVTGWVGGKMVVKWGTKLPDGKDAGIFASGRNMSIMGADIGFLGIFTEFARSQAVSSIYQDEDIFDSREYRENSMNIKKTPYGYRIKEGEKYIYISTDIDGKLKYVRIGDNIYKPNINNSPDFMGAKLDFTSPYPYVYYDETKNDIYFRRELSNMWTGEEGSISDMISCLEKSENKILLQKDYELNFDLMLEKQD